MYPLIRTDSRDTDSIQQRQKGELEYLVFPKLEETGVVEHLFTTRTGGVMSGFAHTAGYEFAFFFMYLSDDERYGFFVLVIDRYIQNGFCFLLQNLLHLFLRSHVFVERFEFM